MTRACVVVLLAACSEPRHEPAREPAREPAPRAEPTWPAEPLTLCATKGKLADRKVSEPAVRAIAPTSSGDAALLRFTYDGPTEQTSTLASGDVRAQIGLKLRAADGCNLIYVMWRLDPKPLVTVQIKRNAGQTRHEQCGANGYTRIKAARSSPAPALTAGTSHELSAQIDGDELFVWADHKSVWRGTLPASARELRGPAGFRSDNVRAEVALVAAVGDAAATCPERPDPGSD